MSSLTTDPTAAAAELDAEFDRIDCGSANRSELTPLRFLQRSVDVFGERTAIRYGARSVSYAELGDEVTARGASTTVDDQAG